MNNEKQHYIFDVDGVKYTKVCVSDDKAYEWADSVLEKREDRNQTLYPTFLYRNDILIHSTSEN